MFIMVGVEIDMVVTDSLKALALYEKIFDIKRVEVSDFLKVKMKSFLHYMEYAFTCWMKTQDSG